jgi:hypothetical protein
LRASIAGSQRALCHLDATLSLFDPDYDPKAIRAKRRHDRAQVFGKGKLARLILDTLRKAERPLSTPEIVAAIAAELNFGSNVPVGVKARIRADLRYLRNARGSIVKEGERATAVWGLK